MTSDRIKKTRAGVFIDGSNLLWGQKSAGWSLDFQKLKTYLEHAYRPTFFNYYGCVDVKPSNDVFRSRAVEQEKFYKKLNGVGYSIITKPLKYIQGHTKGDMDVEIVVDIHKRINDIDTIILCSGDSDYLRAVEDFHSMGKFIRIFSFKSFLSWELKEFSIKNARCNYKIFDDLKSQLEK